MIPAFFPQFKCFRVPVTSVCCNWVRHHPRPHRLGCWLLIVQRAEKRWQQWSEPWKWEELKWGLKCVDISNQLTADFFFFLEAETLELVISKNKGILPIALGSVLKRVIHTAVSFWECLCHVQTPTTTFSWYSSVTFFYGWICWLTNSICHSGPSLKLFWEFFKTAFSCNLHAVVSF